PAARLVEVALRVRRERARRRGVRREVEERRVIDRAADREAEDGVDLQRAADHLEDEAVAGPQPLIPRPDAGLAAARGVRIGDAHAGKRVETAIDGGARRELRRVRDRRLRALALVLRDRFELLLHLADRLRADLRARGQMLDVDLRALARRLDRD